MGDLGCLDITKKSINESAKKAVKEMELNQRGRS